MFKPDRVKAIVGIVLVVIVLGSFVILGQNHVVTRYSAVIAIIIWLGVMFWMNKIKRDKS